MSCKICLKSVKKGEPNEDYHLVCLKRFFGNIHVIPKLEFDKSRFEIEIVPRYSRRMSISGVQQKLSMRIEGSKIIPTDVGGTHILKPAPNKYPGICANEHVTMRLASLMGIDIAECGLISFADGELAYITKRFDREGEIKIHQEDMVQILERERDEGEFFKYQGSYEEVGIAILKATGKPAIVLKFFERLVFNYLIANGDFHLKNISLQYMEPDGMYRQLTPLYDSVNTRVHLGAAEMGDLALDDLFADGSDTQKFNQYGYHTAFDFVEFAKKIGIPKKAAEQFLEKIRNKQEATFSLLEVSYLASEMKQKYRKELQGRYERLFERP